MQNLRKPQPPRPPYGHQEVVTINGAHGLWVGLWQPARCLIYMQCRYMKNGWSGETAVLCNKCLGFEPINNSTALEIIPHSHDNMLGTLKMHPWKCGAVQKLVRGGKSDQQGQWRMWAVGCVTSISDLCAIYICNTNTQGIWFWSHYCRWPVTWPGHSLGHPPSHISRWLVKISKCIITL